jgi:carboxymethylenebutenolidase
VCFYGIPPAQAADPTQIRVPFQGHFANRDDWCTPASVDTFEATLKSAGIAADLFRYEADHGFVNEQREAVHDQASADLAWRRMIEFWGRHLG